MKFLFLLISLFPLTAYAQTQIGGDLIGEFEGDLFGSSVALSKDGKTVVVGSINNSEAALVGLGQIQVFQNVNDIWVQLGEDIHGTDLEEKLGRGVAISDDGRTIAAGADGFNNGIGRVLVFEFNNGSWVQIGEDLVGVNAGGKFGNEVSLSSDGTTLGVGAPSSFGNTGSAHIYQNQGGNWVQLGEDINGDIDLGLFGNGMDISSDGLTIAIGGDGLFGAGALRVLKFMDGSWTPIGETIVGEESFDRIGSNVSISDDGSIVAVSALGNDANGASSGAVRVYRNLNGTWTKIGEDLTGNSFGEQFGSSLSLSSNGNIIAVGAFGADMERIFENTNDNWVELTSINGEPDSFFGLQSHLSKDGLSIAVGAQSFDGNGFDRGLVRVYNLGDFITSTDDLQENNLVLFPNPTSGILTVEMERINQLEQIAVYNNLGQKLLSSTTNIVDLSSLSDGLYYVEIATDTDRFLETVIVD